MIQLNVSMLSGLHQICIPTFPFDPPTQSDTCAHMHNFTSSIVPCYKVLRTPQGLCKTLLPSSD